MILSERRRRGKGRKRLSKKSERWVAPKKSFSPDEGGVFVIIINGILRSSKKREPIV